MVARLTIDSVLNRLAAKTKDDADTQSDYHQKQGKFHGSMMQMHNELASRSETDEDSKQKHKAAAEAHEQAQNLHMASFDRASSLLAYRASDKATARTHRAFNQRRS